MQLGRPLPSSLSLPSATSTVTGPPANGGVQVKWVSQGSAAGGEDASVVEVEMPRALLEAIEEERVGVFESPMRTRRVQLLEDESYEALGRLRQAQTCLLALRRGSIGPAEEEEGTLRRRVLMAPEKLRGPAGLSRS